ncbi:hypothetical protein COS79_00990 [Candidatus Woesearchaeota archaeon CG06_land_8_20_14_3_00_33_13]|nr:MAG: hypothetical protein COS79_00990 [Candidatus Woesearchaeota archaeon CG06_land_8_20_14_3_00_33_13]
MISKKEYKNNKEKIIDFCIGFFGMFAAVFILSNISMFLLMILPQQTYLISYVSILLILYIGLILFFYKKRKYISIGILVQLFIAILIGVLFAYLMFKTGETM